MIDLYTPDQVREMDRRAIAGGVPSLELMERAAGHLARGVLAASGRRYGLRVGILCGQGNNGGDGLAAGRRLLDVGAYPVACLVGGTDRLTTDTAEQLRRYRAAGGRIAATVAEALEGADVAVDCLLGTGSSGEPRGPYGEAVRAINDWAMDGQAMNAPVMTVPVRNAGAFRAIVACDLPTGVDADTGRVPGRAVHADLTVTLGAQKRGLHLWPARGHAGRIVLGDIGILNHAGEPAARVLEDADVAALLPPPPPDGHKRTRGVVVVLAGSPGMSGAATMVARGAMAAGAGLVTVTTSAAVRDLVAPTIPEALTVDLPDDDPDAAFERLAGHLEGADALAVGPGLGHAKPTVELIRQIVREVDLPLVLDADGVNAFRHEGDELGDHASPLLVLTPHAREFARIVGSSGHGVWASRVTLVPEKAEAWGAVVVAKGPGSMVAAPDGRVWVNPTGGASLSTGGTGDVLTGMTTTLVAQHAAAESVAAAVYLHGLAGTAAAARSAVRSVTALDVAAAVPDALRRLHVDGPRAPR
jgi:ADP-dependent NAD(P)H-hydrate dehydratase / NAD(P)H-hydrate epimerase